jgi:hypothetical protein
MFDLVHKKMAQQEPPATLTASAATKAGSWMPSVYHGLLMFIILRKMPIKVIWIYD